LILRFSFRARSIFDETGLVDVFDSNQRVLFVFQNCVCLKLRQLLHDPFWHAYNPASPAASPDGADSVAACGH
jgi:hypothetical protein